MKIYDLVKQILEDTPKTRESDKLLMLYVWYKQGVINGGMIDGRRFMSEATTPESITRARRKVQELHPSLRSTNTAVNQARDAKQAMAGNHVFHEKVTTKQNRLW